MAFESKTNIAFYTGKCYYFNEQIRLQNNKNKQGYEV